MVVDDEVFNLQALQIILGKLEEILGVPLLKNVETVPSAD